MSSRSTFYCAGGKRLFDCAGACIALLLLAPIFVLVASAILAAMGRPILFSEVRAGLMGRPFMLRKFRTMTDDVDAAGIPLPDDRRLTRFGRFLRRTSLDELPELVHVLRGEMSLVGPRPLPLRYLTRYSTRQARRLEVKPGLTGLAQVRGRNTLTWDEKFEADLEYVENIHLCLDLKLLAATLVVVLRANGVNQPGHATMEEFLGHMRHGGAS